MTQLTRPRCIKWPAMLSVTRVTGMRSFLSSHAVSRAPCRKGRVSHAMTETRLPASIAARHQVLDGARHLAVVAVDAVDLARGEEALVEHDHASAAPLDGPDRHAPLGGSIPESRAARHP